MKRYLTHLSDQLTQDLQPKSRSYHFQDLESLHDHYQKQIDAQSKLKHVYTSHIRSLTHDVKTPLTAAKIYVDGMLHDRIDLDKAHLESINQELKEIEGMLPKFIEMDADKLPYLMDVAGFIQRYVRRHQHIFEAKQMEVVLRLESFETYISELDLNRVIEHLVLNSYYYSEIGQKIYIETKADSKTLVVRDEGMGMSKETIDQMLKGPYRSIEAQKKYAKGSGMGYQILKDIFKRHKIDYQIDSVVGEGTTVTIHFHS